MTASVTGIGPDEQARFVDKPWETLRANAAWAGIAARREVVDGVERIHFGSRVFASVTAAQDWLDDRDNKRGFR